MRLFVAVNFTDPVRDAIDTALAKFPVDRPPWRWIERDNWHLTLKFIGAASVDVGSALESVGRRHSSFDISITEFGAFPNLRRPRVLFYKVDRGAKELGALAADVDRVLEAVGIPAEKKPFRAHATVARVKDRLPGGIVRKLEGVPVLGGVGQRVESFDLVESVLERSGARYRVLKQFALGGGA